MAAFTGRTGIGTRTKVLMVLLLLVLGAAAVWLYVLPARDVRSRLARGEITNEDAVALRADPEGWINIVGQVMAASAESGQVEIAQRLSEFMLDGVDSLDPELSGQYGQVAAWVHAPAVSAASAAAILPAWLARLGAATEARLRVACDAFGSRLGQTTTPELAEALFAAIREGLANNAELQGLAATRCQEPLLQAFRSLEAAGPARLLTPEIETLVGLGGPGLLIRLAEAPDLSLKTLYALARTTRAELAAEPVDPAIQAVDLEGFWWETLLPRLSQALIDAPAASPRLWEPIDETNTPLAAAVLQVAREGMAPLEAYGTVDRLVQGAPEHADVLRQLHAEAHETAQGYVARQAEAALASCREAAGGNGVVAELRVLPGARVEASRSLPEAYRTCLDAAMAEVALLGQDALVRPLDVAIPAQ